MLYNTYFFSIPLKSAELRIYNATQFDQSSLNIPPVQQLRPDYLGPPE